MPNALAYAAVFAWPLVVVALFRRLPLPAALCASIVGGYLLLPPGVGVDLPVLPKLDKALIPAAAAGLMCLLAAADPTVRRALRADGRAGNGGGQNGGGGNGKGGRDPRGIQGAGRSGAGGGRRGGRPAAGLALEATVDALRAATGPRRKGLVNLLLALALLGGFAAAMANRDPTVVGGGRVLQGMGLYDAGAVVLGIMVSLLPFVLGRRYLATEAAVRTLLVVLAAGGALYALPTLAEVRLSPQINVWVYGFFPHDFAQHMRAGGFRPIVFLEHGLRLGVFLLVAILAATALWRLARAPGPPEALGAASATGPGTGDGAGDGAGNGAGGPPERPGARSGGRPGRHPRARPGARPGGRATLWGAAAVWLAATLLLSKVLGATMILAALLPVVIWGGARLRLFAAAAVMGVALLYPMLRGADLVPVDSILRFAQSIDEERASSLAFRLGNEDILLERARERPLLGWGGYGRNRVFDDTGRDVSVTDGTWVIVIGTAGWVGYVATFGLLCLPAMLLWRHRAAVDPPTTFLAVILAANVVDLIPNSSLTPLTWLMAGAVAGRLERVAAASPQTASRASSRTPPRTPPRASPGSGARPPQTPQTPQTARTARTSRAASRPA